MVRFHPGTPVLARAEGATEEEIAVRRCHAVQVQRMGPPPKTDLNLTQRNVVRETPVSDPLFVHVASQHESRNGGAGAGHSPVDAAHHGNESQRRRDTEEDLRDGPWFPASGSWLCTHVHARPAFLPKRAARRSSGTRHPGRSGRTDPQTTQSTVSRGSALVHVLRGCAPGDPGSGWRCRPNCRAIPR